MKKLLALLLALALVFTLAACGGDTSDASKEQNSDLTSSDSGDELADGYQVEYTSIVKGYYQHTSIWNANIVKFDSCECMDADYLLLPAGTTIMSTKKFAVYCYEAREKHLVHDVAASEALGQTIVSQGDIQMNAGSYVLSKDTVVRFVVKGALSDIKIYVPLELEDKVKLGTIEDFTTK